MLVDKKTAFVNLHLGITLCERCSKIMNDMGGQFADNVSYNDLTFNPPSLASAMVCLNYYF